MFFSDHCTPLSHLKVHLRAKFKIKIFFFLIIDLLFKNRYLIYLGDLFVTWDMKLSQRF